MIRNALFLCVVCAIIFVFYLPSYVKMQDLNEKNRVFAKRIADLEKDNVRLDEERRRLVEDPVYFEKVAREKMGLIKNDEVIYKIVEPGQKTDVAPEHKDLLIVKQVVDEKAAVKPAPIAPAASKLTIAPKPAASTQTAKSSTSVKLTTKSTTAKATTTVSSKTAVKKDTKTVKAKPKPKVTTVKKSSSDKDSTSKVTTNSTKN